MLKNFLRNWNRKQLKNKRYDFLFDTPAQNEFVSLDCETTGLNPKKDEIYRPLPRGSVSLVAVLPPT